MALQQPFPHLPDAVHVVVAVKGALGKFIGLHGKVGDHQSVEGLLQLSEGLLWEGREERQHQQSLTLKSRERMEKRAKKPCSDASKV